MTDARQPAISSFHLWALLVAWAAVLLPVLTALGYLGAIALLGERPPLSISITPPGQSEEAGVAPKAEPRLAWQGTAGDLREEPAEASDRTPEPEPSESGAAEAETPAESEPGEAAAPESAVAETDDAAAPAEAAMAEVESAEAESAASESPAESPAQPPAEQAAAPSPEPAPEPAPESITEPAPEPASLGGLTPAENALAAASPESPEPPAPAESGDPIGDAPPVADDASPAALEAGETQSASLPPAAETAVGGTGAPTWQRHGETALVGATAPRIAVVMTGLGLSAASTEAAIRQLPPAVTLSFTPYSRRLNDWIALARANNHEVLIDLPMEPATFPDDDPGPYALLTVLNQRENEKRLDWLLGRGKAFVGVAAVMGSRFGASETHMLPVLETLKERDLLYLDNRSTGEGVAGLLANDLGLLYVAADRTLDSDQASRIAINGRLTELERLAVENGFSVAIGQPYPVTIERIRDWSRGLAGRGYALVPLTALAGAERRQQLSAGQ